jgi:hypothetical protein
MANRDLLKEAIADAKAVKETAIANAKLALEEAFTPHLKNMLSAKLQEMDNDNKDVEEGYGKKYEEDDVTKEEMKKKSDDKELEEMDAVSFRRKNSPSYEMDPDGGPVNPVPHKVGKSTVQEEEIEEEINLDELLAELNEDNDSKKGNKEEQKRMEGAIKDDEDHIKDLEDDIKDNEKKLAKLKADEPKDVNESEETLDEAKDDIQEDEKTDAEEKGYLDGMKDEKEDMDDEDVDLEDMSEDDLKGFIEDVIKDMVSAGEIEPGDEFVEDEVEVEDVEDVEVEDEINVDVELDEEMDDDNKKKMEEIDVNEVGPKDPDQRRKYGKESEAEERTEDDGKGEDDETKLGEALAQVNELKAELNEVNLLNAKLLYTNKIFKAKNLTENKKVKVLKAFDKAKDVKQAKTIYETLNEGLFNKSEINESIKKGAASKATGIEPKAKKQPIVESNAVYDRMRKLAGLI